MSESAGLEWRYRRLLAWYPRSFRREQEDEMLAVLMAGARPGQRRPGLLETADVLRSALGMRLVLAVTCLRTARSNQRWTDALALFSVAAPVFLVIVAVLEVAVPYHLPPQGGIPILPARGRHEIGGLSLLSLPFFDIAVCLQVIVAAFALLGWRRLTLTAMGTSVLYWILYWVVYVYGISGVSDALQLLTASAYLLGAAALLASPGPRRGRQLMTWRLWAVLLPAAAFVQVATLLQYATSPRVRLWGPRPPDTSGYLVLSVVFAAVAVALAVALKLNRYFLLLLAAMFYPYAMQLAFSGALRAASSSTNPLRHPTPAHLAVLFVPPLLLACWAMLTAIRPRRSRFMTSPGHGA